MGTKAILMVQAKVVPHREDEFNEWYDNDHMPDAVRSFGAIKGTRYRSLDGDEPTFLAVYEFESEEALKQALNGSELKRLIGDYDARWGNDSTRQRLLYRKLSEYTP